jgi:hypothetical protein
LIEASGNSGDEGGGNENRRENHGDSDHRARDFLHGFEGSIFGGQSMFDVMFNGFNDDDGVVHHQANSQDQTKKGKCVDGEAKQRKKCEGTDERYRDGQ